MKEVFFNKERNIFLGKGRIRRAYYILSLILIRILSSILIGILSSILIGNVVNVVGVVFLLAFTIFLAWIEIGLHIMRSHDIGKSGWYILIPFYVLWLIFVNSEKGTNQYGQNPKGDNGEKEFLLGEKYMDIGDTNTARNFFLHLHSLDIQKHSMN